MAYLQVLLISLSINLVIGGPLRNNEGQYSVDPAVTRFRKYLQIDTSKEENLERAVEFWRQQALELGLPFHVFRPGGLPVCVLTMLGSEPSLPSIILNSHMDVVPAVEKEWTYPPYSAYMDDKGDIYARGAQDAKDVACQYVEAIRRLKQDNIVLKRTLHVTFMPDEETGGFNGMKKFVETDAFKAMNVGFVLDEGLPTEDDTLFVLYQDRRPWQIKVTTHGEGGHGSGMPDNTSMDKAKRFINAVDEYRERMKKLMKSLRPMDFGGYTSVNINIVSGGYKPNIIPSEFNTVVDMRLAVETNVTEMEQLVQSWIDEAGSNTELTFIRRDDVSKPTVLDDSNPYWKAMSSALNAMSVEAVVPAVLAATSDSLVLRNLGIPAVGFAAKTHTTNKIHSNNEYLNADTFLQGIDIYYSLLKALGNLSKNQTHGENDSLLYDTYLNLK